MLPGNAQPILDARLGGMRPAKPIVVSYVGDTELDGPHVHARSGWRYDWRFLVDLPTIVVVKPGVEVRDALSEIFAVARLYPTLVDVECQNAASVIDNRPLRLWPFGRRGAAWQSLFA